MQQQPYETGDLPETAPRHVDRDAGEIERATAAGIEEVRRLIESRERPGGVGHRLNLGRPASQGDPAHAEYQHVIDLYPSADPVRLAEARAAVMKANAETARAEVELQQRSHEIALQQDRDLQLHPQQVDLARGKLGLEQLRLGQEQADAHEQAARATRDRRYREMVGRRDDEFRIENFPREAAAARRRKRARIGRIDEQSRREMSDLRRAQMRRLGPKLKAAAWTAAVLVPVSNFIADQPEHEDFFPFSVVNDLSDAVVHPLFQGVKKSVFGQGVAPGSMEGASVVASTDGSLRLQTPADNFGI